MGEHHGLDVDGGAEIVGDSLVGPVGPGPGAVPAAEDRFHRSPQLRHRVVGNREPLLGQCLEDAVDLGSEVVDAGGPDAVTAAPAEPLARNAEHGGGVHREEAPVALPGEPGVTGGRGQPGHGGRVETEVEDGVEHAGH